MTGFVAELFDHRKGMADRLVLRLTVARIGPRKHAFPRRRTACAAAAATALPALRGRRASLRLSALPLLLPLRRSLRARLNRPHEDAGGDYDDPESNCASRHVVTSYFNR